MRDPRAAPLAQKDAKHAWELTVKQVCTALYSCTLYYMTVQEAECRHLISAAVPAGSSLVLLTSQVAAAVDTQQQRPVWVPSGSFL